MTTYTYDDLGNRLSEVDPNGHSTTYSYQDSFDTACPTTTTFAFLTKVTDALGHVAEHGYDSCTGLLAWTKDANDIANSRAGAQYSYDYMNRVLSTTYPDGGSVTRNYNNDALPLTVTTTTAATPSPSIIKSTIYDGLGRTETTKLQSDPAGTVETDTTYDGLGRVASVSNPYRSTSDPTYGVTSYTYDAFDRKTVQTQPDNSTQAWTYNGNAVTFKDEAGSQWQRTSDGIGRLTKVLEPSSTSKSPTLETDYAYDALGDLLSVNQKGVSGEVARTRSFSYDSLSRLVTAANPETGTICYGTYSGSTCGNGYDAAGNLLKKTDARGITVSYSYDSLNRMTAKSSSDGTLNYAYYYDASDGNAEKNPIGRLTFASNQVNAADSYSYDPLGRVIKSTYCVPQDCRYDIAVSAVYDLAGHATSLTYPDTRTVSQGYNGAGEISSVTYASWGSTAVNSSYLTAPAASGYDAAGHLVSGTMGNGVQISSGFNKRESVASLGYALGSQKLWSKQYSWYANQDLQLISDGISGLQREFTYDDLNRLQTAQDLAGTSGGSGETTATSSETEDNALESSQQLGGPGWGGISITPSSTPTAAPDGSQTAAVVTANGGSTDSYVYDGVANPSLYDGAMFVGSVWLRVPSGTLATNLYLAQIGDQGFSIPGQTAVTLTTTWQKFTVSGTLQNGLTSIYFQIGGGGTIVGGKVFNIWGTEMGPTSPGGAVTNILPASEQVTGPTWLTVTGAVTNSTVAAPDGTSTAQTLTASAGSADSFLVDYIANPGQYSGKTVTASVYLRVASGTQNLGLFIVNYGSSGYSVPNSEVVTLNTSWQRFDLTATNQAGLTTAYFQIGGGGTLTGGAEHQLVGRADGGGIEPGQLRGDAEYNHGYG